jgi:Uma2 family endonuclease
VTDLPGVAVQYSLPASLPEWELPEVPVPESPDHDIVAEHLTGALRAGLRRLGKQGVVHRNLAIRWDREHPKVGVDPDVCWVESPPPGWPSEERWDSLRLWLTDGAVPPLAIEIVSRRHPYKDYGQVQDKYAAVGVRELWVYDPKSFGPRRLGGPRLLQVWCRTPEGVLTRRHFGDEPARSELLGVWLFPKAREPLLIADDASGHSVWRTPEQAEQVRADAERARADAERARADAEQARADAERARADALERELAQTRGKR